MCYCWPMLASPTPWLPSIIYQGSSVASMNLSGSRIVATFIMNAKWYEYVLMVTEPHDYFLLPSWLVKFLVCRIKDLLNSWYLHDRYTKLAINWSWWAFQFTINEVHVPNFIFGHLWLAFSLGSWRYHVWNFVIPSQASMTRMWFWSAQLIRDPTLIMITCSAHSWLVYIPTIQIGIGCFQYLGCQLCQGIPGCRII